MRVNIRPYREGPSYISKGLSLCIIAAGPGEGPQDETIRRSKRMRERCETKPARRLMSDASARNGEKEKRTRDGFRAGEDKRDFTLLKLEREP